MIFIIIDFVENVGRFIDAPNSGIWLILRYYTFYLPQIIYLIMPVIVLIASLFSVMSMSRYNEIIALKSTGISLYRIILPLIITSLIISTGMIAFGEYVVPEANRSRLAIENFELKGKSKTLLQRIERKSFQDNDGNFVFIDRYDISSNLGQNIYIQMFAKAKMIRRIDAKRFRFVDNQWLLFEVAERDFSTSPGVLRKLDSLRIQLTGIYPQNLQKKQQKPDEMNYRELDRFIEQLQRMGTRTRQWEVARNSKLAYPFASLIVMLFGATLAANKRCSGPALGFLIALTIVFVYYFIFKFMEIFGQSGDIHPLLSSWAANIIFAFLAGIALFKVRQ
jgi:lipopolysaccharide export system permease protein